MKLLLATLSLLVFPVTGTIAQETRASDATAAQETQVAADAAAQGLDVGDPAPPLIVAAWPRGPVVDLKAANQKRIVVLLFFATWSEPSRTSLGVMQSFQQEHDEAKVTVVGITEESAEEVRAFLASFKPQVRFPVAIDQDRATASAYCAATGIGFVPYAFVIGPDGKIAWHGHPLQAELKKTVAQLLDGSYDRSRVRQMVLRSWSVDQLEATFRDAYAAEAWHAALLALDGLLKADVPKTRLLRYKLSILLGELGQGEEARALADEIIRDYGGDAAFLNSTAWDVVSDPRMYVRAPDVGLKLARAAYRASAHNDPAVADTYARALYLIGRVDLAAKVQKRAVALTDGEQKTRHEQTLAFYERCLELQPEATAEP